MSNISQLKNERENYNSNKNYQLPLGLKSGYPWFSSLQFWRHMQVSMVVTEIACEELFTILIIHFISKCVCRATLDVSCMNCVIAVLCM